jgi:hypothetical protein
MTIGEFINKYILLKNEVSDSISTKAYLAQHPLFDQVKLV